MAKRNSIDNIRKFTELLSEELEQRFGAYPTIKDMLFHLAQKGIIRPITLRNYIIVNDFYIKLRENEGHMTHTFMDIGIEYELSERQVQSIIYDFQKKFQSNANIIPKKCEKRK
tara:strand:- start:62 stop:403 length:342 start_codon:yes stop_codon:yes gene_type:complete